MWIDITKILMVWLVINHLFNFLFGLSFRTPLFTNAFLEFQVGNFIHYLSTFLAGLVVGFVSAWRLALLSVAVIPGIAFAGGLYAYTLTGLTSKSRESYANAGIIAEQVRLYTFLFFLSHCPCFIWVCFLFKYFLHVKWCFNMCNTHKHYYLLFLFNNSQTGWTFRVLFLIPTH